MTKTKGTVVVAVGGNALILDADHQSIPDQSDAAVAPSRQIADMIESGWRVVFSHGSGPQVGFNLRRSELAEDEVHPVPLDYADADLQGAIGYMFQQAMHNELRRRNLPHRAVAIVTQVLVDPDDPAFSDPSKPVGAYMSEEVARQRAEDFGWTVVEDAGRGWRRTVASPAPQRIVELDAIVRLLDAGYMVIACGGGGIPVVEEESGDLVGREAVIDKDYSASLLASNIRADLLLISTGVDRVAINFNQPDQRWLDRITLAEARRYDREGHFAEGSMGPKVRAIVGFLERGGQEGLITHPDRIGSAMAGRAGTRIVGD